jgi:hypothetical protein
LEAIKKYIHDKTDEEHWDSTSGELEDNSGSTESTWSFVVGRKSRKHFTQNHSTNKHNIHKEDFVVKDTTLPTIQSY